MICPVCKSDMIVVEYHEIELDYCNECRGVWFDAGELELILQTLGLESEHTLFTHMLQSPPAATSEKLRKCPICGRKMRKTNLGGQPELLVDLCSREDGIWFDGGEVAQLIKQLAQGQAGEEQPQQKLINFLGEVFQAQE
jgi:Zn-finger nucleic acid-binding protein